MSRFSFCSGIFLQSWQVFKGREGKHHINRLSRKSYLYSNSIILSKNFSIIILHLPSIACIILVNFHNSAIIFSLLSKLREKIYWSCSLLLGLQIGRVWRETQTQPSELFTRAGRLATLNDSVRLLSPRPVSGQSQNIMKTRGGGGDKFLRKFIVIGGCSAADVWAPAILQLINKSGAKS